MRGVAPSLFGKPLLGKGLSTRSRGASVPALLPLLILQQSARSGNGADGIRTRSRQVDSLLLYQLSYRPSGTDGTRHARLSDARILSAGDLPSRPPFSINPFTQVHGARCLGPRPLITDKARSYTGAQATSPRYPVDQGWA